VPSFVSRLLRVPTLLLALTAVLGSLLVTAAASPADASATLGQRAVAEASHHRGAPYRWGAAGPRRFDCSGFTLYVYKRLGRSLPHSASAQYSRTRHISKSSKRPGDLVFMKSSSGRISHVGIYAGQGKWWVSPHSGSQVKLQTLYSSRYVVGRVR